MGEHFLRLRFLYPTKWASHHFEQTSRA